VLVPIWARCTRSPDLLRRPDPGGAGRQRDRVDLRQPAPVRPSEDLDRYPRTLEEDLTMCAAAGWIWSSPRPRRTCIRRQAGGDRRARAGRAGLRGSVPAGFLRRRADVVLKLLHLTRRPWCLRAKDAQQLALVRRLVTTRTWRSPSRRCHRARRRRAGTSSRNVTCPRPSDGGAGPARALRAGRLGGRGATAVLSAAQEC